MIEVVKMAFLSAYAASSGLIVHTASVAKK